jgi:hypothetical protein
MISKSPERNTFQKESYVKNAIKMVKGLEITLIGIVAVLEIRPILYASTNPASDSDSG